MVMPKLSNEAVAHFAESGENREVQRLAKEIQALRNEIDSLRAFIRGVAINCNRVAGEGDAQS